MNILHVGWGFLPFRTGGLIEYAEDLMEIQAKKGYLVSYFCTGRFLISANKPFLKKWQSKKGYTVYEVWNPPVISGFENGIKNPLADVTENSTERFFMEVLRQLLPDVVHIQEFLGFPTSLIEQIKQLNIKTVYTVEDYYYLCPTIRLILPDGGFCRIKGEELGKQCAICCRNAPKNNLNYKLQNVYPKIFNVKTVAFLQNLKRAILKKPVLSNNPADIQLDKQKIDDFNARRSLNLDVLPKIDRVIAMSNRVAEIFSYYMALDNMITLNLMLRHVDDIRPLKTDYPAIKKINFAVINVLSAPIKGRDLLMEVFALINATSWKHKIEFIVMGRVDEADKLHLQQYEFIKLTGKFKAADLNGLLDRLNANVGIVPSVWEEAYGFVGIEFLAKGIPVIGNKIGGIPDYVTKETGWLNETCDAAGLFRIITDLVNNPGKISSISNNLATNRVKYVKTMDTHFNEMDAVYRNLF